MYSKLQVRARVRGFRGDTAAAIEGVQRLPPHRGGAMAACSTGGGKGLGKGGRSLLGYASDVGKEDVRHG